MSSTTIKIPVQSALSILKDRLAEAEKATKDAPKIQAQYEKDVAAYNKKVSELALKSKKVLEVERKYEWIRGLGHVPSNKVLITFEIANLPEAPKQVEVGYITLQNGVQVHLETAVRELKNTIRMLELTDQTHVPASIYKSFSQYI